MARVSYRPRLEEERPQVFQLHPTGWHIAAGHAVKLELLGADQPYIFAVYPHRRFVSPKVRVFVDALRAAFGDGTRDPWWP